jgi:hypothetical protein
VIVLGRLRTKLVRAFFGWGSTNKLFPVSYAEIQGLFTAKRLKQNLFQMLRIQNLEKMFFS